MAKKYLVTLTDAERDTLLTLTKKGAVAARKLNRAHILLQADANATDVAIAAALHIGTATVERTRKRFLEGGLEAALTERPRPGGTPKLDGKAEAILVAWTCSTPPDDRTCWTMQLLADKLIELKVVDSISDETVRRTLKKRSQALAEARVVYSDGQPRVRLAHGGCSGAVCRTVRPGVPGGLFR
jgi:transposase